jgi:hypothetical protein
MLHTFDWRFHTSVADGFTHLLAGGVGDRVADNLAGRKES